MKNGRTILLALLLSMLCLAAFAEGGQTPAVYMTTDISPEGLQAVYAALGRQAGGNVAVKISTGEPPASNYLRVELIGDFVRSVNGAIVECNTAYGGSRASTAMHYQVAEDHGYTAIATVDIMDENGSATLPVVGGTVLTENYVGANLPNYDFLVVLSHFKGHSMAGFGGALKNLSIGCASAQGKSWIHSGGTSRTNPWGGEQNAFLEAMAEAAKSVVDAFGNGRNALYINVMNRLSVDCDCNGNPAQPDMHDIGILASLDPVALDQACIDLVYASDDGGSLIRRIESRSGVHTVEHAQDIGLGSRAYTLVPVDAQPTPTPGQTPAPDQTPAPSPAPTPDDPEQTIPLLRRTILPGRGDSFALKNLLPPDSTGKTRWTADQKNIVRVKSGKAAARNLGTTVLRAEDARGNQAQAQITVTPKSLSVRRVTGKTKLRLNVGTPVQAQIAVKPDTAQDQSLIWISANPAVVRAEDGLLTPLTPGKTRVYALSSSGKRIAITVTVRA